MRFAPSTIPPASEQTLLLFLAFPPFLRIPPFRSRISPTFAVTVTHDGPALFVQGTGRPRFRAYAESASTFFLKAVAAQVEFAHDSTGAVEALFLVENGTRQRGVRSR